MACASAQHIDISGAEVHASASETEASSSFDSVSESGGSGQAQANSIMTTVVRVLGHPWSEARDSTTQANTKANARITGATVDAALANRARRTETTKNQWRIARAFGSSVKRLSTYEGVRRGNETTELTNTATGSYGMGPGFI